MNSFVHSKKLSRYAFDELEKRLLLSQATQLVFTSSPLSLRGAVESSPITVQLRDATNAVATAGSGGVVVNLATSSTEGVFLNGDNFIASVTIPAGSSSASFQYEDNLTGAPSLTASSAGLTSATQQQAVSAGADPFLKTSGTLVKNAAGTGDTVALHGVNLGGWLDMEDWMTPMDSGSLIDNYSVIQTLDNRFGVATEQSLIKTYQNAWLNTTDLDNIKALGMNVVRLPFWWGDLETLNGTMRADAFAQMDWLVNQAWQRGIYTILDFHGVPGGQSNDEPTGQANQNQYWTNAADQASTLSLWQQIAGHYKNNPAVAGYDLMNEPFGEPSTQAVWNAYSSLYNGIRAVDPKHIIVMEGTYGNWDWDMLPNPANYGWTNIVYEMHEYQWNSQSDSSGIRAGTDNQVNDFNNHKSWNVPDYVGEFNDFNPSNATSTWKYTIQQYNADNIDWTAWTYKSTSSLSPNTWGVYAPTAWGDTPNIASDSAATIAADWGEWTTANLFTTTSTLVRSMAGPLAVANQYATAVNTPLSVSTISGVLSNDVDANAGQSGITLAAALVNAPAHGTVTLNTNGSFTYTPASGYSGADSFRYRVSDGFTTSTNIATATIMVGSATFPAPWNDADIGAPAVAGGAQYDAPSATWTLSGSGADIYNAADQFNFASQTVVGDYTIIARVASMTDTNAWAKAGVMFRNDDSAGSASVNVEVTPENGVTFQYRSATGGTTANVTATGVAAPRWVKLMRSGNSFGAYYSADGKTWTQVGGNVTVALNSTALAGLAVSAHDNTQASTATFSNVIVAPTFARMSGTTLQLNFAEPNAITLSTSGSSITATQDGATLTFANVASIVAAFDAANPETLNLNAALSPSLTLAGSGASDTLNVNAGTFTAPTDLSAISSAMSVNVAGGAKVLFGTSQHLANLSLSGTGSAAFSNVTGKLLVTQAMSVAATATLDLGANDMIYDYSGAAPQASAIAALIAAARSGGTWSGAGVTSSAAKIASPATTTLGVMEATDYKSLRGSGATFDGQAVDDTAVLVKYTYYGDANFDGAVNFDDYTRIDSGYTLQNSGWANGDFDLSGKTNFDDYSLIDRAYIQQGSPFADSDAVAAKAVIAAPVKAPKAPTK